VWHVSSVVDICRSVQAGVLWLPAARLSGADGISAGRPARGSEQDQEEAVRRDEGSKQSAG